ncbi:hypothetical protein WH47_02959 [Habropoda laboriosa]|uniref:DUF4817 domain-containing protein n=1 Tax=Habropoda laboriosa TaxID=597456 RepID=A0A0L7QSU0_9HYME|nr:hypothetical protein WH47_02959 [Habropoda laboriosa]
MLRIRKFVRNRVPDQKTIKHFAENFREFGTATAGPHTDRPRIRCSVENLPSVSDSVEQEPNTSVRRRAQELRLSFSVLGNILTTHFSKIFYCTKWMS